MSTSTKSPGQQAKDEAAKQPSRDDVHEQREQNQEAEGVVKAPHPPTQTQSDEARADWEGMAQPPPASAR